VSQALKHDWSHRRLDVIRKTVFEKVQTILAIHAIFSNDVGRVNSIPEELYSDTRRHVLLPIIDFEGRAKTNETRITTAEHACVRMVSQADPGSLGHISNTMEGLLAAVKLITLLIEASSRFDLEVLVRMPVATGLVSCNLLPDDLMLGRTRLGEIVCTFCHPVVRFRLFN